MGCCILAHCCAIAQGLEGLAVAKKPVGGRLGAFLLVCKRRIDLVVLAQRLLMAAHEHRSGALGVHGRQTYWVTAGCDVSVKAKHHPLPTLGVVLFPKFQIP